MHACILCYFDQHFSFLFEHLANCMLQANKTFFIITVSDTCIFYNNLTFWTICGNKRSNHDIYNAGGKMTCG